MPLLYRAKRSTLKSLDGIYKWFPNLVKFRKQVTTSQLAEQISYGTTLTPGDIQHVIHSIPHYVFPHLLNSRSVHLEGFGTFTLKAIAKGNGVNTEKEVNPGQISYLKVQFTPEFTMPKGVGKTRSQFTNVEYVLWGGKDPEVDNENNGEGDNSGGGDEFIDPSA